MKPLKQWLNRILRRKPRVTPNRQPSKKRLELETWAEVCGMTLTRGGGIWTLKGPNGTRYYPNLREVENDLKNWEYTP